MRILKGNAPGGQMARQVAAFSGFRHSVAQWFQAFESLNH